MAITLLTGPVASGKSRLAARIAGSGRDRCDLVATAEAGDDEMRARIARHRAGRPARGRVEEPLDLAGAIAGLAASAFAIVDCLTLWVTNLARRGDDRRVLGLAAEAAAAAAARAAPRSW